MLCFWVVFNIGLQKTKALIKMATSQLLVGLVFRFQLDYSCRIKSVPPEAKTVKRIISVFKILDPVIELENRAQHKMSF